MVLKLKFLNWHTIFDDMDAFVLCRQFSGRIFGNIDFLYAQL